MKLLRFQVVAPMKERIGAVLRFHDHGRNLAGSVVMARRPSQSASRVFTCRLQARGRAAVVMARWQPQCLHGFVQFRRSLKSVLAFACDESAEFRHAFAQVLPYRYVLQRGPVHVCTRLGIAPSRLSHEWDWTVVFYTEHCIVLICR